MTFAYRDIGMSFYHNIVLWSQCRRGHVNTDSSHSGSRESPSSKSNTTTWCHWMAKTRGHDCATRVRDAVLVANSDSPPRRHHEGVKWEPTSIIDGPMHALMRAGDKRTRSPQLRLDGGSPNARAEKFTSHENFIDRGGKAAAEHIITEWESERELKAGRAATKNWCDFSPIHYFLLSKGFEWCTWEYILYKNVFF